MLKELLDKERKALLHFFDELDLVRLEEFLQFFYQCSGIFILTGVGKSGFVAEKMAATFTATGSRSLYLSPSDALHGDIGIITQNDLFVTLSKSGESEELLNLIPYVRNKGAKTAAIVTKPNSRLAKACDMAFFLPEVPELCPHNLAPTTSTVMQMILGDLLAVGLMQLKNFTVDQFAMNHPAGRIGRRIFTRVKDLMLTGDHLPTCSPQEKLMDLLVTLSDKKCGCLLVLNAERQLVGILTDGDLRRALRKWGEEALTTPIEKLMTTTPRSISENELATTALFLMEQNQKSPITVLAVLNSENRLVGLIRMHDILQAGL